MKLNATELPPTRVAPLIALGSPGSKIVYGVHAHGRAGGYEVWLEPHRTFVNAFPSLADSLEAVTWYFAAREAALAIAYRP